MYRSYYTVTCTLFLHAGHMSGPDDASSCRSRFWAFTVEKISPARLDQLPHLLLSGNSSTHFKAYYYYYDPANHQVSGLVRIDKPLYKSQICKLLPHDCACTLVDSLLVEQHYTQLVRETAPYRPWHFGSFSKFRRGEPSSSSIQFVSASARPAPRLSKAKLVVVNDIYSQPLPDNDIVAKFRCRFWAFAQKHTFPGQYQVFCREFLGPADEPPKFVAYYFYYDAAGEQIFGLVRTAEPTYASIMSALLPDTVEYWPIKYKVAPAYHATLVAAAGDAPCKSVGSFARLKAGSLEASASALSARVTVAKRLYADTTPLPGLGAQDRFSLLEEQYALQPPPAKRRVDEEPTTRPTVAEPFSAMPLVTLEALASRVLLLESSCSSHTAKHGALVIQHNDLVAKHSSLLARHDDLRDRHNNVLRRLVSVETALAASDPPC